MAPDVVDLISSSPPPTIPGLATAEKPGPEPTDCMSFEACTRTAQLTTSRTGNDDPTLPSSYSTFPSSDHGVNTTSKEVPFEAERSPKRRRLRLLDESTPKRGGAIATFDNSPSGHERSTKLQQGQMVRLNLMQDDIHESDSDPFVSSPALTTFKRTGPTTTSSRNIQRAPENPGVVPDSSAYDTDVSARFPQLAAAPAPKSTVNPPARRSPDPFASSPQATTEPLQRVKITLPRIDSSDPFASSPPERLKEAAQRTRPVASPTGMRPQPARKLQDYDPISSSAPEPTAREHSTAGQRAHTSAVIPSVITIESDSDRKSSDDELPDIHDIKATVPRYTARSSMRRALSDTYASNRRATTKKTTSPNLSTEERAKAREAKQRSAQADKEAKKQDREQQKRIRALEKEKASALAEVNKIRTDKKVSTKEMVVDLPAGLKETLRTQTETILEGLDVPHTMWQSPVPNAIKLRRKVDSRFDDDLGYWVPCPSTIEEEDYVIVVITAAELVKLAQDGLGSYIDRLTTHFPKKKLLYILEGVTPWMRKNRNARNKQFASGVRAQEAGNAEPSASQPRRRATATHEPIDEEIVEDVMLQLQVIHGALVHHTNIPLETAQWIGHFTQHISTVPYRRQRERSTTTAGFCMDSGQVRTGDDVADTYVRMLQEVARVTQPIAYGVAAEFGSVTKLVKGLQEGGQTRLEGVRKSANKDGAFSDRTLGKAMSKRLWQVFLGWDETSTDV